MQFYPVDTSDDRAFAASPQVSPEEMLQAAADEVSRATGAERDEAKVNSRAVGTRVRTWADNGAESDAPGRARCACVGAVHDRTCLGCGTRLCSCCAEGSGAPCGRCFGPVWADAEERTPPRRNPAMKGW